MRFSLKEENIKFKGFREVKTVWHWTFHLGSVERNQSINKPRSHSVVRRWCIDWSCKGAVTAKISPVCEKALPALNTSLWVCWAFCDRSDGGREIGPELLHRHELPLYSASFTLIHHPKLIFSPSLELAYFLRLWSPSSLMEMLSSVLPLTPNCEKWISTHEALNTMIII